MKYIITDRYLSIINNTAKKKLCTTLSTIVLSTILMNGVLFPQANAQIENCYNLDSANALPVILIHGWNEGSGGTIPLHWDEWTHNLSEDNIPFCIISFEQSNDACGSAADHAKELAQIVQDIISETGQNQVNIVGFSKGGLDARVYLANDLSNDNVANLIMIGTPNAGTQMAFTTNDCSPGIDDLKPNAPATNAKQNTHTKYYTIAGACFPWIGDGLVSTSSVNSQPYFKLLGTSNACHLDLLDDYEYKLAHDLLTNRE
jgi:pimeloyl-ACP methyl ester carboxylesterase